MDNLGQPSSEALDTRLKDFQVWLDAFNKMSAYNGKIKPIDNAALLLNQYYWNVVQAYIRPLLSSLEKTIEDKTHHLINRFKIISITELSIMAVLPFDIIDDSTGLLDEEVNARFAWYCAIAILTAWDKIDSKILNRVIEFKETLNPGDAIEQKAELTFRREHIQLLTTLDTKVQLPVLSNAQTWRMFYFCTLALSNKLD